MLKYVPGNLLMVPLLMNQKRMSDEAGACRAVYQNCTWYSSTARFCDGNKSAAIAHKTPQNNQCLHHHYNIIHGVHMNKTVYN